MLYTNDHAVIIVVVLFAAMGVVHALELMMVHIGRFVEILYETVRRIKKARGHTACRPQPRRTRKYQLKSPLNPTAIAPNKNGFDR